MQRMREWMEYLILVRIYTSIWVMVIFSAYSDWTHYILRAGGMLVFIHVGGMHVVWSVAGVPTKPSAAMEDTSASHMQVGQ